MLMTGVSGPIKKIFSFKDKSRTSKPGDPSAVSVPFHMVHWKWLRLIVLMTIDFLLVGFCYYFAFVLRLDTFTLEGFPIHFLKGLGTVLGISLAVFSFGGMYRQVWRHGNLRSALLIARLVFLSTFLSVSICILAGFGLNVPRSVPIIFWLLTTIAIVGVKFSWRTWSTFRMASSSSTKERCLVYGAGSSGDLFIRHVLASPKFPYLPVGFIDDDLNLKHRIAHGLKVLGTGNALASIAKKFDVEVVVIAIHAAPGKVIRHIVELCHQAGLQPLIMPELVNTLGDCVFTPRPLNIDDMLKRSPMAIDRDRVNAYFKSKTVLVTGAGGSIGSEICRQVIKAKPSKIVLFEINEYNLYRIDMELRSLNSGDTQIESVLGSITSQSLVRNIFERTRPEVVLHAAAYKHVPLVENNPLEGVINNVLGTKIVAEMAAKYKVEKFLLISTDKAVRPTNIMGATKRVCELLIQSIHAVNKDTSKFCLVRFGNVLGSSGSVVPLFVEQIKRGGPVTVTHPEITRFFMLINEAVGLVLQSIVMSQGGETFVLNMGEPVKIYDMARNMIRLSGKEPESDIEIEFTGLRPGEKLYEELLLDGTEQHTLHDDVLVATSPTIDVVQTMGKIDQLIDSAQSGNLLKCRNLLSEIMMPDFTNNRSNTDEPLINDKALSASRQVALC